MVYKSDIKDGNENLRDYEIYILGSCCKVMFVSASEKTKSKLSTKVGKFRLYKTDPNEQPIYANSRKQYLYVDSKYGWSVGEKVYIIMFSANIFA